MSDVAITLFSDAACPIAFSSEPRRLRLRWHYGDQLSWALRSVMLIPEARPWGPPFTADVMRASLAGLIEKAGMPIDIEAIASRPAIGSSKPSGLAVTAAVIHAPGKEQQLLRALRVRYFAGAPLDDPRTITAAAEEVGIAGADLDGWLEDPEVATRYAADADAARTPLPAAKVLDFRLATAEDGRRHYTCPTYELRTDSMVGGDEAVVVPGFQDFDAYDVAIANLAPGTITRKGNAETVTEVLEWAEMPLATTEIAGIRGISLEAARSELQEHGAAFTAAGSDGYWTK